RRQVEADREALLLWRPEGDARLEGHGSLPGPLGRARREDERHENHGGRDRKGEEAVDEEGKPVVQDAQRHAAILTGVGCFERCHELVPGVRNFKCYSCYKVGAVFRPKRVGTLRFRWSPSPTMRLARSRS